MAEALPQNRFSSLSKNGVLLATSDTPEGRLIIAKYLSKTSEEREEFLSELMAKKVDQDFSNAFNSFKQEVKQVDPKTGMMKMDLEKVRMDLIPYDVLFELGKVYTVGAKKYSDRNWEKGTNWGRPFAALMRHLSAWWQGEDKDPETGMSHMLHAAWNALTLVAYELRGIGEDDRP
jgi:hypothetical protein